MNSAIRQFEDEKQKDGRCESVMKLYRLKISLDRLIKKLSSVVTLKGNNLNNPGFANVGSVTRGKE